MGKYIDLTGQRFGRLVCVKDAGRNNNGGVLWKCICDCDMVVVVSNGALRSGGTVSCGCLRKEKTLKSSTTHGMSNTPTYHTWVGMIQRCTNPNSPDYHYYGARGVKVCKHWLKFDNFFKDMGERPKGLTLERKNTNGDYNLSNCKWASWVEQNRNRRLSKHNKTGIIGVHFRLKRNKYEVRIKTNGKNIYIGSFTELRDAAEARKQAELKYWGESKNATETINA